jgi:hypothetical protein
MGKGKEDPSPLPSAFICGGELTEEVVLMRLISVAEGKEVLAYLVLASLRSSAPPTPLARAAAEDVRAHQPELGCGCFGCYTADGSPEAKREAIHRAIKGFKEHLARTEE